MKHTLFEGLGLSPAGFVRGFSEISLLAFFGIGIAAAQTPLQITAPGSGTVVYPGRTVTVAVSIGIGVSVGEVIILGENPIGVSGILTTPPFQFSLAIPDNIKAGQYYLTAAAVGLGGQYLQSTPIPVDVEPSVQISSLQIQPGTLSFRFVGESLPMTVLGALESGGQINLTQSSMVSYTSGNTSIAAVASSGIVTAVGAGSTNITVSGPASPVSIFLSVPSTIRGDLNGDGKVNIDDVNILDEALNTPATKPADARDLNGDGMINALDARILVTLCTKPGCATH